MCHANVTRSGSCDFYEWTHKKIVLLADKKIIDGEALRKIVECIQCDETNNFAYLQVHL